jgi:asparagine synthase (glutamine-hydrolysing)
MYSAERHVSPHVLEGALAALHHRGPDSKSAWVSSQRRIGLAHARLSIIDLETGGQPIANEDETARIVVNGEFYDYERVRRRLELQGHRLRTRSDSEIAIHLYEELGTQFVHELRGEYALAIWDERASKLIAVRDRFGVKPLFYAVCDGMLYLASEIKALFAAGVPARWDPEVCYFSPRLCPPGRTPFRGVNAVPPGCYLTADHNGISLSQYWDIDYPLAGAPRGQSEADYIEGFRTVFEEAVRLRLKADVPVACYLSGGIDSAAVLGAAARHRTDPIHAFTVRFVENRFDEGLVAEESARNVNAEWLPVEANDQTLADNFSDAVFHAETMCDNANFVGKYLLSRAVRDAGFKVVLTGEGSDEVLGGYWYFRRDMAAHDTEGQDMAEIRRYLAKASNVDRGRFKLRDDVDVSPLTRRLLGFVPSMVNAALDRLNRLDAFYRREYFEPFKDLDRMSLLLNNLDVKGRLGGRSPVHQSLYLWSKTSLPNYILTLLGDRMEMAHSLEGRVPFLDHKVTEYVSCIPVSMMIRGSTEKYILREAMKDLITGTVYRREKHPFVSPPAAPARRGGMWSLIQDTLRSQVVDSVPFLEGAAIRRMADELDSEFDQLNAFERGTRDMDVMTLVSTIHLHERLHVGSD